MTITLTITDPTADESRAVRAYLDALHGGTAEANPSPLGVWTPPAHSEEIPTEQFVPAPGPHFEAPTDTRTVTVEVTAEDAGAPDFDSAGLPWDERIHASSRATVADGTWRKKRGVSDELVAEVEAELRGKMAEVEAELRGKMAEVNEPDASDESDPAGRIEAAQTVEVPEVPAPVEEQSAPEVPDAPVQAPDSPPPPPAAPANPFLAVMSRIGKSKLDKAKKDELLTAAGALDDKGNPSILVLNKRPELIDGFVALLDSEGV